MYEPMNRGLRVIWAGRTGTVHADFPENWQTAGVEFDDEKGVVVQKLKSELTIDRSEYAAVSSVSWEPIGFVLELNLVDADPVPSNKEFKEKYGTAVKADAADLCKYQPGDRVKLKYNRSCGTVVKVSTNGWQVSVRWDKLADDPSWEKVDDLVTLWAPRDNDPVNPNQEAIDAIEVQRKILIKEVDAVQARLRTLTMAKKLLERG